MSEPIRLQKILAHAGFGSRRACEKFIVEGRVTVDGVMVRQLGSKADPETQAVALDGQKVTGPGRTTKTVREGADRVYYILNKPKGVLCTNEDPSGRPLAVQMIPERRRIYCVGRLDLDTEGLILLTNDGELTNQLTHPRYGVSKTYLAKVSGNVSLSQIRKLEHGVHLAEGRTHGALVRVRKRSDRASTLELTISEGMNRQVRRMLAHVDLQCHSLKRVAIGPLRLGELPDGAYRKLSSHELESLWKAIEHAAAEANKPRPPRDDGPPRHEAEEHAAPADDQRLAAPEADGELEQDEAEEIPDEEAAPVADVDRANEPEEDAEEVEEQEPPVPAEMTRDRGAAVEKNVGDGSPRGRRDTAGAKRQQKPQDRRKQQDRPWRQRAPRDADPRARPWEKREGGAAGKPWQKRAPSVAGKPWQDRQRAPRDADPRARPWQKREPRAGGKPWQDRQRAPRDADPRARPWQKREGGAGGKPRQDRQRTPRDADSRPRPWQKREGGSGGKPWQDRQRTPRDADPRARPWEKRERGAGGRPREDRSRRKPSKDFGKSRDR